MKNNLLKSLAFVLALLLAASCHDRSFEAPVKCSNAGEYRLEQVIVLSRHNIRSPLTTHASVIDSLTPHHDMWHKWSSTAGRLTLKGAVSEVMMGQYFKLWLESEGFIPLYWQPDSKEVLFYANTHQRTVATARCFASGLSPAADIRVKYLPGKANKTFVPFLSQDSEVYGDPEVAHRCAFMTDAIKDSLHKAYAMLEYVLDYEQSYYFKVHGKHFADDGVTVVDRKDDEPKQKGMLKTAVSASDALILQSYEEDDLCKAAFGKDIGEEGWARLADILSFNLNILFSVPEINRIGANGMLKEINKELGKRGRKFTFLCGHDSTLFCVLAALDAEPWSLEGALERKTPISCKLVLERRSRNGGQFVRLRLVYPSWQQLRELPPLDLDNPPMSHEIHLRGLTPNADGFYSLSDFRSRLTSLL